MSPDRAGALLLCFLGGTFAAGAPASDAAWFALSILPWALALACVPELPWRPALAAWAAWLGWAGVCAMVSPEPWLSLTAWWRGAAMLLSLALACSWWSRRERRLWALVVAGFGFVGAAALVAARFSLPFATALATPPGVWAAAGAAAAAGWLS
ncbi:MAG: hypothetical protein HY925_06860, partial [Elusimicrobia bacterium]|nr:hypothetical protein [Elusimicrobiota bacterium]